MDWVGRASHAELDRTRQSMDKAIAQRLRTLQTAEALLLQRERDVAVREAVLQRALTTAGPHATDEASMNSLVVRVLRHLPVPVSVSGLVANLEERAVSLEAEELALRLQHIEVKRQEEGFGSRRAELERRAERAQLLEESAKRMLLELEHERRAVDQMKAELQERETAAAKRRASQATLPVRTNVMQTQTVHDAAPVRWENRQTQTDAIIERQQREVGPSVNATSETVHQWLESRTASLRAIDRRLKQLIAPT